MGDKWEEVPVRHRPLMALATRQHGVVSTRQLKALGYGRNSASKANRVGRLRRLHRGVYAVGHVDLTRHGEVMASVLACQPAVVSHWTAGWLHDLFKTSSTLHLTAPSHRRPRRPFTVHVAGLSAADLTMVDRIPVTSIHRTLLDLSPHFEQKRLKGLLGDLEKRSIDFAPFEGTLARAPWHLGHNPLEEALLTFRPDLAATRSNLEREFRELVRASGLPMPAANFVVGPYEIDAYWEAERFGVELDVFATHGTRDAFEEDRKRADDLLAIGVEITRVTDLRLAAEADAVIERIGEHLARRRRQRLTI